MEKAQEDLLLELAEKDTRLKRLYTQHQKLERELASVTRYAQFSSSASLRANELKKAKLRGMDELMSIVKTHQKASTIRQ